MKQDDLTQVKNIGVSRMKLLNSQGITTFQQLHEMPLEELAKIKNIGVHYSKLIKNAVAEYMTEKHKPLPQKTGSVTDKKIEEIDQNLRKQIQKLKKTIAGADEYLKPLWEKKYLKFYLSFKKRSNELKDNLETIIQKVESLSQKAKKKIIKEAKSLNLILKKVGENPRKNEYKKIIKEIKSFPKKHKR